MIYPGPESFPQPISRRNVHITLTQSGYLNEPVKYVGKRERRTAK